MIYGYCRVSTRHQNLNRQIDTLIKYGVNERFIVTDKYSDNTLNREGLNELLSIIRSGDALVVKEIDRLGRNRKETKDLILFFIKENIDLNKNRHKKTEGISFLLFLSLILSSR